jgi:glycosidase
MMRTIARQTPLAIALAAVLVGLCVLMGSCGKERALEQTDQTSPHAAPSAKTHAQTNARSLAQTTPSTPVDHDPSNDVLVVSPGLGLVDVTCRAQRGAKVTLVIDGRERASMIERGGSFRARVRIMGDTLRYTIEREGDAPAMLGPFEVGWGRSAAPVRARMDLDQPTPDWAKGATWYQIFPERFRNANPANDPRAAGDPASTPSDVFLAPWTSDWYRVQAGEREAANIRRGRPADAPFPQRTGGDLYHVIWDRRYGGDLQGIVEKFDHLVALGITAIYLNPIFEAQSLHKYDASDYRHIDASLAAPATPPRRTAEQYQPPAGEAADPATWTWTPADRYFVDVFLPEAKRRGLRVILDGVWNHVGRQFWAFDDVRRNGARSPYADWFRCEFDAAGALTSWTAWDGKNGWLPEFRQVDPLTLEDVGRGDLAPGPKAHIFAVTRRWMDPNNDGDPSDGIDGWRLDVAAEVGNEFWRDWRTLVKRINPDALIVAEIWSPAGALLEGGRAFDTQMHYPFAYPVLEWLTNQAAKTRVPVASRDLARRLDEAFGGAPQTLLVHQNLLASHDTDRLASITYNPGREYDRDCSVQNGDDQPRANDPAYVPYKPGKPDARSFALARLGLAIQATYLGSPMVYCGDEFAMWGADDPTCRKPVPWDDLPPNDNPDDRPDHANLAWYAKWLNLRNDPEIGPALRWGLVQHLDTARDEVFAFERSLDATRVLVIVNRGNTPYDASALGLPTTVAARDAIVAAR